MCDFAFSSTALPGAPQNVTVKENYPNLILLAIEPPREIGGVKLVGYRVEYDNKIQDFSILGNNVHVNTRCTMKLS